MTRGKKVCKILKEIRQQIADKNDIEYITSECHFHGECKGTCPKCEAEVQYLENELHRRRQLGKVATVAGIASISIGVAMTTFSSCEPLQGDIEPPYEEVDTTLNNKTKQVVDLFENHSENFSQNETP